MLLVILSRCFVPNSKSKQVKTVLFIALVFLQQDPQPGCPLVFD